MHGLWHYVRYQLYHLQMALENRHVYPFFLEYEMQTPIEDYECNQ